MTRKGVRRGVFSVAEANATLPLVRAIATDLATLSRDVTERRRRLSLLRSGHELNAADLYHQELIQVQKDLETDAQRLRDYVEELRALGVESVDSREGIVSFPSLLDGRRVCLCWKLGEPEVLHWHEMDAGYRQRQQLPAESIAGS